MRIVLLAGLAALSTSAHAFTFGAAGGAIPDNNIFGISSSVFVAGPVTSITDVTLLGLRHTWVGDLHIYITNPENVSVSIMRKVQSGTPTGLGDSSNLGTGGGTVGADYVFANGGTSLWTAATGGASTYDIPSAATYEASGNLFTNSAATSYVATDLQSLATNVAGNWTLTVIDNAGSDTGAYTSWEVEAVPEPGTMAVLGMGALLAARRRRK